MPTGFENAGREEDRVGRLGEAVNFSGRTCARKCEQKHKISAE